MVGRATITQPLVEGEPPEAAAGREPLAQTIPLPQMLIGLGTQCSGSSWPERKTERVMKGAPVLETGREGACLLCPAAPILPC